MATLHYVHDPMCSWCWGFVPTLQRLIGALPPGVEFKRLLGGLAPDSDEPMDEDMQQAIQGAWRRIEENIPGTHFNFDFWTRCQPRRSTYPACRAVIAARLQGEQYDELMTKAIQQAYYRQARNPSDNETLLELAAELGLDTERFRADLDSDAVQQQLMQEIEQSRELFVESYPALVLEHDGAIRTIEIDYNDATAMLEQLEQILN